MVYIHKVLKVPSNRDFAKNVLHFLSFPTYVPGQQGSKYICLYMFIARGLVMQITDALHLANVWDFPVIMVVALKILQ